MHQTRYQWIDNCKAIGLLLVILGHGRLFPESWQQFIYSFHMPLFFILSGLLYKYKSPKETLVHDILRLLIPYVLINIICLFVQYGILYLQGGLSWEACYNRVIGILVVACHTGAYPPVSGPTWFIITLFFARMLLSLSDNKIYRYLLLIGSVLCFIIMKNNEIDTYLPVDSALMSIPFIVLGIELSPFKAKEKWGGNVVLLFLAIAALSILVFTNKYNGLVDMAWSSYGRDLAIFYVNGVLGSFALMALIIITPLSAKIQEFCTIVSKGSLMVIGFNLLLVMTLQTIAEKLIYPHPLNNKPLIGVIIALVILYIFYWMTKLCQRYFPVILGTK